jgi:hypothetical protein
MVMYIIICIKNIFYDFIISFYIILYLKEKIIVKYSILSK